MKIRLLLNAAIMLLMISDAHAAAVEPNYAPGKPPVTNAWYAHQNAAQRQADLDFIAGMRPHHAGALTMSDAYLKDRGASDLQLKALARGIMHNQTFEIGMLDRVESFVKKPVNGKTEWRQIAEQGLAQKQRFTRAPMPGPLSHDNNAVSVRDVQFAKAMVVHHQAALDMAKAYLANPNATNKYLRLLCLDILVDQKQEIAFMNAAVGRYPGDANNVKIDASMIHGMEGMHHGAPPKTSKKKTRKAAAPKHETMHHEGMSHEGMGH